MCVYECMGKCVFMSVWVSVGVWVYVSVCERREEMGWLGFSVFIYLLD